LKYGVYLYPPGGSGDHADIVGLAQGAERLQFDSAWIGDHVAWPKSFDPAPHEENVGGQDPPQAVVTGPVFEPLTTLAYLAASVQRIRLGLGVLVAPYRNPVLCAKMLAMLDILSGGRLIVGVGAGWMREEFTMLGAPPFENRGTVTDEYIQAFIQLWTEPEPHFEGTYAHVTGVLLNPKPIQSPHPPVWVGGNGEAAMRRAAAYGQGWMPLHQTPAEMEVKIRRLRQLVEDAGRHPDEVAVAVGCGLRFSDGAAGSDRGDSLTGTDTAVIDQIRRYQDAGVSEVRLLNGGYPSVAELTGSWERFAAQVAVNV
jgi:probable F420-dependent oxidoreductase